MHMNFLYDAQIIPVEAAAIAATTTLTTDVVDTQGFDSVAFVAFLGDVTATSVLTLTGFTNDTNDTDTPTQLGSPVTFTAGASDADGKLMVLDLHKPRQRYAYATLARATANAVVNGILAILYNAHDKPVNIPADVIASGFINDPAPA
ncbi:MAG: hypothetical protein MI753_09365 [Hyphomicrobiales bacterium]|nr:hypothetical protein [Hyphomicrobiales bacterium]